MRFFHISGHRKDRFFLRVNDYVDDECQFCFSGCPYHIFVDRVAFQNTGSGLRIRDELGAMVGHNGNTAGYARQYALSGSGKAREEMRLDKALRHQKVCVICHLVDQTLAA